MKRKKMLHQTGIVSLTAALIVMGAGSVFGEETGDKGDHLIILSDDQIMVDGEKISEDSSSPVYAGAEIVYYHEGQGELYGEGDAEDEHSAREAAEHTVITITQPGTYRVTGSISRGQIAVDLGEEAEEEEAASVNLILDNADITCTAASAIVVYNFQLGCPPLQARRALSGGQQICFSSG